MISISFWPRLFAFYHEQTRETVRVLGLEVQAPLSGSGHLGALRGADAEDIAAKFQFYDASQLLWKVEDRNALKMSIAANGSTELKRELRGKP